MSRKKRSKPEPFWVRRDPNEPERYWLGLAVGEWDEEMHGKLAERILPAPLKPGGKLRVRMARVRFDG